MTPNITRRALFRQAAIAAAAVATAPSMAAFAAQAAERAALATRFEDVSRAWMFVTPDGVVKSYWVQISAPSLAEARQ